MIGQLRREWQRSDARKAPPDEPDVERGDRKARDAAACRPADAGAVEYDRPGDRDAEVNRHGGGEQSLRAGLPRQQDRPGCVGGLERVAAGRKRVHGRGDPAQGCGPDGGSKDAHAEG